ncbi:glutamate--tRNA ligase [Ectobacillus antri]|jgi:nondiscriminating glutamyl-tRNA synthetase|uniref:Glutamate--tRNA ligase n=1 Tax=Ectobacillus antri TaxID=2486280 RepID=A0ABT6H6C4_9BACI|nr:glutamate--tRNA ligase [Ectobacillus antri]MDG4657842.1 glutamate--tRNA ligase [Ectobacillus antri]MDG5754905.1 glutamate--tRNA ligase [Ectobacillus antri]
MDKKVRLRYAPSPTGHLHIGNTRTALFNYLFAKHHGGDFIIRIEDTDLKRNVENGEKSQLKYLKWLGIEWDESVDVGGPYGPYRQTERLNIYRELYEQLLEKGLAYKCYLTEEELEAEREAQMAAGENPKYSGAHRNLTPEQMQAFEAEGRIPSIRFRVPENKEYVFNDMVKGEVRFGSEDFGDFVIVKKDGIPTYNFAVAVDDYLMKITHVLRGEEHISNTPKQMMIYEAFGWDTPIFGHMTLIVNENRKKLSKRDESVIQFIQQYEELGYLPEALLNFIGLLGWSPGGEEEIFTKEQFIDIFDSARLSKSPAVFDTQKLTWMNNQYIKKQSVERVMELCMPHLVKAGRIGEHPTEQELQWVRDLVALYQEQLSYGAQIVELSNVLFKDEISYDEEAATVIAEEQVPEVLEAFAAELESLEEFTAEAVQASIKAVQKKTGQKGKKLFMPIRVATTGQTHGPDLPKAIALLGKQKVLSRISKAIR